jgi:hypothetical protein
MVTFTRVSRAPAPTPGGPPLTNGAPTAVRLREPAAARPDFRPPVRRPATGRAVGKLVLFFSLVVVLAFALNAAINHGLRKIKTSEFGAFNRVMAGAVNADIVVSGSSRALVEYDPARIQQATGRTAYNIGMNASQIDLELAMLKTYLAHNARPKLVIQNLDLFSFETTKPGEIYNPALFLPHLAEPDLYQFLGKIEPDVWKWRYIPLYGYAVEDMSFTWARGLLGCVGVNPPEDYFLGFNPRHQRWTGEFDQFRNSHRDGVSYKIEPEGVASLQGIIDTCRERGIALVLVFAPEYSGMQTLENNRGEIMRRFEELAKAGGAGFWDYSNSPLCRQQELFYNSQHLNDTGAALFSDDLANRLAAERPWEAPAGKLGAATRRDSGATPAKPEKDPDTYSVKVF